MDVPIKIYTSIVRSQKFSPNNPPQTETPNPVINPENPFTDIGIGIKLNSLVIGGVKRLIELTDVLQIPEYWQYNIRGVSLDVDGTIENNGEITIG